jgi:iron complex transport system ATP-binding protein
VLSVVHDLSLARRYGTHAILMDHGKCVSQGLISEVMTPENLRQVYDMDVFAWMREMLSQWKE